jgi:hypothetical protein
MVSQKSRQEADNQPKISQEEDERERCLRRTSHECEMNQLPPKWARNGREMDGYFGDIKSSRMDFERGITPDKQDFLLFAGVFQ